MKQITFLVLVLISATSLAATVQTFDDGMGNISWSTDGGATSCGCTPSKDDDIIVNHEIDLAGLFEIKASLTINSGGKLNIINSSTGDLEVESTGVVTINNGGVLEVQHNLDIRNGAMFMVNNGGAVTVGNDFNNFNNSDDVTINGSLAVSGDLSNGNNGDISGSGSITVDGNISNNGTIGGSTGNDLGTLPVEVLYFEGSVDAQNHGILEWATTSEENFDFFTIERSTDGVSFEDAGKIGGAGNSKETLYYTYIDENKINGTVYYRLKATDIDGFVEYHGVVSLHAEGEEGITVFPNPCNGKFFKLTNNFSGNGTVTLEVLDMSGRAIYSKIVNFGQNTINFPGRLDKGNYFVIVRNNLNTYQEKLIVQ